MSISYEWDPCDAFKVNELLHLEMHGAYQKSSGEDERSMWTGLVGQKGRSTSNLGGCLNGLKTPLKSNQNVTWPTRLIAN